MCSSSTIVNRSSGGCTSYDTPSFVILGKQREPCLLLLRQQCPHCPLRTLSLTHVMRAPFPVALCYKPFVVCFLRLLPILLLQPLLSLPFPLFLPLFYPLLADCFLDSVRLLATPVTAPASFVVSIAAVSLSLSSLAPDASMLAVRDSNCRWHRSTRPCPRYRV